MSTSQDDSDQNPSYLVQSEQLNHLLAILPEADYIRLAPHLREVNLSLGQILYEPAEPINTVYFPNQSMISLVQIMENGSTIEAGIVGNDGMLGYPVYLGGQCDSSRAIVQIAGSAIALAPAVLKAEFDRAGALQKLLLCYTQAFLAQVSQTAACNRFHPIEERLARWLLQSQDFARSSTLQMTQDFLSSMLGTRRASITVAAGALQEAGFIYYQRGYIHILNREALESAACECYNVVKAEYNRLLETQIN
ncbi:MAG: Crp/Fnr family transcriptional regulator [Elainellaceae cyanobacterium]